MINKAKKILRKDRNQCPTCSEYFNSTVAFVKHRTGEFTNRRCLTVDEMLSKNMAINYFGFWVGSKMPKEQHYIRETAVKTGDDIPSDTLPKKSAPAPYPSTQGQT
jgi:hypothetical protein